MSNPHASTEARNVALDAIALIASNGYLRVYSGAQPANGNASLGAAVLLAELRLGTPAFGAAAGGSATANAITPGTALATERASFLRIFKADGVTPVIDGDAGDATDLPTVPNLVLTNANIQINTQVAVSALTLSIPA